MNHLPQHFLKALIEYLLQDRKFVILMKHFVFLKAKQLLTLAALFIRVVEKLYVGQSQLKKLKDFFKNIVSFLKSNRKADRFMGVRLLRVVSAGQK